MEQRTCRQPDLDGGDIFAVEGGVLGFGELYAVAVAHAVPGDIVGKGHEVFVHDIPSHAPNIFVSRYGGIQRGAVAYVRSGGLNKSHYAADKVFAGYRAGGIAVGKAAGDRSRHASDTAVADTAPVE